MERIGPMMGKVRNGFTLIELLIVIGILSVLAAVLLPVLSKAREEARQCVCVSNTRQLISASLLYTQDYDEKLPIVGRRVDGNGRWMWQIIPYVKNAQIFTCPLVPSNVYDGTMGTDRTGYGWAEHLWAKTVGPAAAEGYQLGEIGRPAETIVLGDTGYDGAPGWAMYRRPPWIGSHDERPGYYPQFRHNTDRTRPLRDTYFKIVRPMPLGGFCSFAFLDGHSKALTPGIAFRTASSVNGVTLTGDDRYLYWNRY